MKIVSNGKTLELIGARGPAGPDGNPIGTVISYMGTTAPDGYLICDGTVYNISEHSDLAAFFVAQFGASNYFGGNGTATFAVPDMRNLFLRGYHGSAAAISGDLGKRQEATSIPYDESTSTSWNHAFSSSNGSAAPTNMDTKAVGSVKGVWYAPNDDGDTKSPYATYTTRPVNMAVLYCIKAEKPASASDYVTTEQMNAAINAAITGAMEEAY